LLRRLETFFSLLLSLLLYLLKRL